MVEYRHAKRIDCNETCVLRMGDVNHVATVKNISFGGALVHFDSPTPRLHIGDICNISMIKEFICEYSCEVVRDETPRIGLMFIGMHKFKAVDH